jgi:hypothetical protein
LRLRLPRPRLLDAEDREQLGTFTTALLSVILAALLLAIGMLFLAWVAGTALRIFLEAAGLR